MHKTPATLGLLFVLAAGTAAGQAAPEKGLGVTPAKATSGACELLTDVEIQSVQSEAPGGRKASAPSGESSGTTLCYFALPTASKSISLTAVRRGNGKQARDPQRQWRTLFERGGDKDRDANGEKGEEEHEAQAPPQKIGGMGDAAYWAASPVGGSLYVLKGHSYLRISVGGPGDQAEKIRKSKTLAAFALKRL